MGDAETRQGHNYQVGSLTCLFCDVHRDFVPSARPPVSQFVCPSLLSDAAGGVGLPAWDSVCLDMRTMEEGGELFFSFSVWGFLFLLFFPVSGPTVASPIAGRRQRKKKTCPLHMLHHCRSGASECVQYSLLQCSS